MDLNIIYAVINTLNQVEVKGAGNLNRLLAAIQTLEGYAAAATEEKNEEAKKDA